MTTTTRRRLRGSGFAVAALSLLLALVTLATARPVAAADTWSTYSMTYQGTAAGRGGGVGASGGLVSFSGGPGAVIGRLDAAPSGSAEASSIEPGTMARLVGGQVNDGAGEEVVGEPLTARAEFPGDASEDSATQAGPQEAGPLTIVGGEATAAVGASGSQALASVARFRVAGEQGSAEALRQAATVWRTAWIDGDGGLSAAQQPREDTGAALLIEGAYADGYATADPAATSLESQVEVGVDRVLVMGTIAFEAVVGRATATAGDTDRSATADLSIASVTVAGVPVALDETGLSVAEQQVVNGADVAAANEELNTLLVEAGIQIRLLETVEATDDRSARASSGGVAIEIVTPSSSGVPRNVVAIVLGRGEVTLAADPAYEEPAVVAPTTGPSPTTGTSPDTTLAPPPAADPVPATPPTAGGQPPSPQVAEPAPSAAPPQQIVAAGMTMSTRTAYAGFAAWMVFTFSLPLLGALLLGRKP